MPRMRTIDGAHAELLREDPGCELTKTALRRMVITGQVPSCRIGTKYLVDLDTLPAYIFGVEQPTEEYGTIRRVAI